MRDYWIGCDVHKRSSQVEVCVRKCITNQHCLKVHEYLLL